jgi:hypothetical protein
MKKLLFTAGITLFSFSSFSQCACCSGASIGSSNGDYNSGTFTLGKKQFAIEGFGEYRNFPGNKALVIPAVEDTAMGVEEEEETPLEEMYIGSLGLKYGITDKFTVSALLPYVSLKTKIGAESGLGDLNLLGTYQVYSGPSFNFAMSGGAELPTGEKKKSTFDNTTIVFGSGSVDPMLGIAASKSWDKFSLQFNTLGKYTTKGFNESNFSSLNIQNLVLSYRFIGESNCSPDSLAKTGLSMNVYGGYYGEWLGQITEDDELDENSGYYLGFATAGTMLSVKGWSFPITISIPVIQNLNGEQGDAGIRARIGIIKKF